MTNIGAYEAKAHLSEILKKVSKGERYLVTKHGTAIAQILPANTSSKIAVEEAIKQIKEIRKNNKLGGLSIRELREEGRKA